MKRIKLALIIALMMTAAACQQVENTTEPITVEPVIIQEKEAEPEMEIIPEEPATESYVPSPEYKPSKVEYIPPMPEPEPESEPTAQVAMFEDNNQVVVEVVYEGNCYVGDVHEQLFQENITEGTEIPVYTLQGTFFPIEGFEGETWYEFQGDAVWTLDESYLGFTPSESEEYTLFFSDNWTTETSTDDFFICVQDY
jgi:hypothetical protein